MFGYIKCGKLFAVHVEFAKELGARPYFSLITCKGESIIDIPYGRIIITPGKILRAELGIDGNEKADCETVVSSPRISEN